VTKYQENVYLGCKIEFSYDSFGRPFEIRFWVLLSAFLQAGFCHVYGWDRGFLAIMLIGA